MASSTSRVSTSGGEDEKKWSVGSPSARHETDYADSARAFIFGDFHFDTHRFRESAWQRAPKEIACAAAASALVSPLVSVVDRCLVQEIAGKRRFGAAAADAFRNMTVNPGRFFGGLGFRLTFAVYFGTYAVANLSELALDVRRVEDDEERKNGKVAASGVANIGLLAWRDSVFARTYSQQASGGAAAAAMAKRAPLRTLGLFAARDMGTMYATFYLAPLAAKHLQREHGWNQNASELSAALAIPAAMQVSTAPLHIHAMDYYAKPSASFQDRWSVIRREFGTASFVRGFRILPAFGLGSFGNNKFREMFIRQTDDVMMPIQRRITRLIGEPEGELELQAPPMLATSGTQSQ